MVTKIVALVAPQGWGMKTRTPRMTPHCRVMDSGRSFVLNSTRSRPDLSLAPSFVVILRTSKALLPSSSWISSSDHVVNSLKKMVPKHELWNRVIVTGYVEYGRLAPWAKEEQVAPF